jgi:hypothetical protein
MGSSQSNTIKLGVNIKLDPRILIKSLVAEAYRAESFTIPGNLGAPKVANDYHQENIERKIVENSLCVLNPKNLDDININNNIQEEHDKPITDFGGKEEVKEEETNTGNFDNNKGRFQGNNMGFNYSDNDLSLSQSVYLKQQSLEESQQFIDKGFLPVFLKINDFSPLYFFINQESTLNSLLREYIRNIPETDDGILNKIKLYHKNILLDFNKKIRELGLKPYSIITNKIVEEKIESN